MRYMISYETSRGARRRNEDSLCALRAATGCGEAAMICICDGMGGAAEGEKASARMAKAAGAWFAGSLPELLSRRGWRDRILPSLTALAERVGGEIRRGGTTAAVLLAVGRSCFALSVGDTRIYRLRRGVLRRMTEDQTLAEQLFREGRLSREEADRCPESHVLLQCVGGGRKAVPERARWTARGGDVCLVCSDGFRRKALEEEMAAALSDPPRDGRDGRETLRGMMRTAALRGETDNMSAAVLWAVSMKDRR